jgi:hypothetical protein
MTTLELRDDVAGIRDEVVCGIILLPVGDLGGFFNDNYL